MLLVKIQQIFLACTIIISYINIYKFSQYYPLLLSADIQVVKYDGHKIMKIDLDEKMPQRGP